MSSMKVIWYTCVQQFQKWLKNPRIITVFILFFALVFDVVFRFNQIGLEWGVKNTPWFLPFFLVNSYFGLYTLLGFVLLFCDAPFIDRHQPYVIIRIGKLKWVAGQILYIVLASFVFLAAIQIFMIVVLFPTLTFSKEWGSILYTFSITNMGVTQFLDISRGIIMEYSPLEATILSFGLAWLEGIAIGCLMFLVNFRFKHSLGTILGCLYAGMFFFIKQLPVNAPVLWYIIPSIWMEISSLATGKVQTHPGVGYAVCGLVGIILLLCLSIVREVKRQPIEVIEQI